MLQFEIQGSGASQYRVRFAGEGPTLAVYCSCPAGRLAGNFCKHAAALLNGEFGAVTAGADWFPELARRSAGSPLRAVAATYRPGRRSAPATGFASLPEVAEAYRERIAAKGLAWVIEAGPRDSELLRIGAPFKSGGVKKAGQIVLSYEPWTLALDETSSGEWVETIRPSTKHWRLAAGTRRAFMTLDSAVAALDEALDAK